MTPTRAALTLGSQRIVRSPNSTQTWSQASAPWPVASGNYVGTVSVQTPRTSLPATIISAEDAHVRMASGTLVSPRQSITGSAEKIQGFADMQVDVEPSQYSEVHHMERHSRHHVEAHTSHAKYNLDTSVSEERRHSHDRH